VLKSYVKGLGRKPGVEKSKRGRKRIQVGFLSDGKKIDVDGIL